MSATPSTAAPTYLQIDPEPSNIILGTANLPSTLTVSSAFNGGGLHDAIIQTTASKQPGWAANALVGTYIATNIPGAGAYPITSAAGTSALVGVPGFTFNGTTQFFEYDTIASTFSGTEVGVTVVCVVASNNTSSGPYTVWSLGAAGATPSLKLQFASGNLSLTDSNGPTSATINAINTTLCVVSATRNATSVSLRVWSNSGGVPTLQTATAAIVTPTAQTFSTFCVGALNSNGSTSALFSGTIGKLGIYGIQSGTTVADIEEVEAEWMLYTGISRIMDIAQTSTTQEE